MNDFKLDKLEIVAKEENGIMKLVWRGTSDARNPAISLIPYLDGFLEKCINYKLCMLDFAELEFMNSSTIATILYTIKKMKDHPAKFELIFSKKKEWQEVSFRTMRILTSRISNISIQRV